VIRVIRGFGFSSLAGGAEEYHPQMTQIAQLATPQPAA
jgi:hypothetical protein